MARVDRGAASALYFGIYYACGALGAYLPGLAWEAWGWEGWRSPVSCALGVATGGNWRCRSETRHASPIVI